MSDLRFRVLFEAIDRITAPFRSMQSNTDALRDGLTATKEELKKLESQSRDLEQLEKLRGVRKAAQEQADAWRESVARYQGFQATVAEGSKEWKRYQKEIERARNKIDESEDSVRKAAEKMGPLRDRLRESGVATHALADAQAEMRARIAATNAQLEQQSAALAEARRRTKALADARQTLDQRLNRATGLTASGMSAVSAGTAGLTTLNDFTGDAKEAEHQRAAFGLTAGLDNTQLEQVRQKVKAIAGEVNQDASQLQDALGVLVGKGMDPKDALVALQSVGRAATATGADMNDMATLAFAMMDNLKVAPEELGKALDIATKSGDLGGFELKDMARNFPQLTASAQALGLTGAKAVATLASALQIAAKGAASNDEAANNMSNFLAKITAPETVKRFDEFGIDIKKALTDAVAKGENPFDAMLKNIGKVVGADLEKEMDEAIKSGLSPERAAEQLGERFQLGNLFGDMQVLNALGPLLANMGQLNRIRSEAIAAEGTVNQKFAVMMQTSAEIEKASSIAWKNLKETLGASLLPTINQGTEALRKLMITVSDWAGKNPETARTLLLVAGAIAAVVTVGGGLAIALAGLVAPIAAVQFAMATLNIIMAANPIGLIVVAVGLAIAALVALAIYWDQTVAVLNYGWEFLKTLFAFSPFGLMVEVGKVALAAFRGDIGSVGEAATAVFDSLWNRLEALWQAFINVKNSVASLFSSDDPVAVANLQMPDMVAATVPVPQAVPVATVPTGAAAPGTGSSVNTSTTTVTVNAAPGMDERQVAEEVRRQLQEKEARERADKRNTYADQAM